MEDALQVTFKGIEHSSAVEQACGKYFEKLAKLTNRIVSCHVVVSGRDEDRTNKFHSYHLTLNVPGTEIVITNDSGEVHTGEEDRRALRETFERARHRLDEFLERRRDRERA